MRNPKAEHIDFGFMEGIIPNNEKWLGSNIDMCFERKGKFLYAEWKRPNENMLEGQRRLLRALSKDNVVLIVNGISTKDILEIYKIYKVEGRIAKLVGSGLDCWIAFVRKWYDEADSLTSPNEF